MSEKSILKQDTERMMPKVLESASRLSDCRLNKHCLINLLGAFVNETRLGRESSQVGLPPKILQSYP